MKHVGTEFFRRSDTEAVMPLLNGTRTLTEDDSDGIYVRCSDESHQDWPVKDDIFRQALIIPFGR